MDLIVEDIVDFCEKKNIPLRYIGHANKREFNDVFTGKVNPDGAYILQDYNIKNKWLVVWKIGNELFTYGAYINDIFLMLGGYQRHKRCIKYKELFITVHRSGPAILYNKIHRVYELYMRDCYEYDDLRVLEFLEYMSSSVDIALKTYISFMLKMQKKSAPTLI